MAGTSRKIRKRGDFGNQIYITNRTAVDNLFLLFTIKNSGIEMVAHRCRHRLFRPILTATTTDRLVAP
jgi:hypothetical protein